VVSAFTEALEQPPDALAAIYEGTPNQTMKLIRYPGREAEESDQGVGAHKDSGLLTLLLQDAVGGLQVQGKDGWIDAVPVPGTFVVNIGELLELASNGYLRATVHRVVSPKGARPAVGRLLPRCAAGCHGAGLGAATASRGGGDRPDRGSGQSAVPQCRRELPQGTAALAPGCGAEAPYGSAQARHRRRPTDEAGSPALK
jgi:hypothetical protein